MGKEITFTSYLMKGAIFCFCIGGMFMEKELLFVINFGTILFFIKKC